MSKIFDKLVASIYPLYLAKVEKKGRTRDELDEVIRWLTGFDQQALQHRLTEEATFRDFFAEAALNENASLITGSVCGVFVENVDDPLMQEIRYLEQARRRACSRKGHGQDPAGRASVELEQPPLAPPNS